MIVLVTGGAGFIGSNLIQHLLCHENVDYIYSLDNYSSGTVDNEIQHERVHYVRGNTWDIYQIEELMSITPTVVFHFGEFSRIVHSFDVPEYVFQSNLYGTSLIMKYCSQKQAKMIYACSSSIFGNGGNDKNLNPYSWAKATIVELLKNYEQWFGLHYAITYFYNVYGPRQIEEGNYATVIGLFERQVRTGQPLTVVSPGTQTRCFTHVEDIVKGLLAVAFQGGQGDGYHLCTDQNTSILELASWFQHEFVFIPERRGERLQSCIPTETRATTELGWTPQIKLQEYVSQIIQHDAEKEK